VRNAFLTLALVCFISRAAAQQRDPADNDTSPQVIGIAHHAEMIGQLIADATFVAPNGKETTLSSYRGRPLLIDLWATWCGPCLTALPALNSIYSEVKDKGLQMISFDEAGDPVDEDRDAARAIKYLARH
jgi:cytochrome oxidase Cu insertion factor (SCO1/SenC/PrrC family)